MSAGILKRASAGVLVFIASVCIADTEIYIPDPTSSKPWQMHGWCSFKAGRQACLGYPARAGIPRYLLPATTSQVIFEGGSELGYFIPLIEPTESREHPGWVPVVDYYNDEYVVGWIKREDIVLSADLRRVVGCWPIKMLGWYEEGAGDYDGGEFRLLFDTSGAILPTSHGYALEDRADYIAKNLAVYYSRGVFLIRHRTEPMGDLPGLAPIFGLDYQKKHVTISAPAMETFFELFPDEALKGCAEIPQVDPNQGIKFK